MQKNGLDTKRFLTKFVSLCKIKNGFKGTLYEITARAGFSIDIYFYQDMLPTLIDESILVDTKETKQNYIHSKKTSIYKFSKDKAYEFIIKNNPLAFMIYKGTKDLEIDWGIV